MRRTFIALLLIAMPVFFSKAAEPLVESYLVAGNLKGGEEALSRHLQQHADDDEARFGLGVLRFVRSIEKLAQGLYRYGALGAESRLARLIPLVRFPLPDNPNPDEISFGDLRSLLSTFVDDLATVDVALAEVDHPQVQLPLHFGLIRLDIDQDGQASDAESLWRIYADLNRAAEQGLPSQAAIADEFVICFDAGDVHWLRGYCHLLSALTEMFLAYDAQSAFEVAAPSLFARPKLSNAFDVSIFDKGGREADLANGVAMIHLMSFPVVEEARLASAHAHLRAVIDQSRLSWKAIESETDDNCEWVPNAAQHSVVGVAVTSDMIAGWWRFLDEADSILTGEKLAPHWRIRGSHGVNLRRVFIEPRHFDLVLWVHGAAARPYLEKGDCTSVDTWRRFQQLFGGNFIGFAVWFN